jgi:ABC-type bacteriocin/lantibiotic exporter with double-glycine peptidase domain
MVRMQDSQANCGPFALKNALEALGIQRSAVELEKACGTTATKGTPLRGIYRAAVKIEGCDPVVLRERRMDVAMLKLDHSVRKGRPAVLIVDQGNHWVAVVGTLGDRYLVADSGDSELVLSYGVGQLEGRWRDSSYEGVLL